MKVLKFGGSSLATPATIREVGRILLDARRREPVIGVVSAFQGVTNQLLECARLAERADSALDDAFEQIARRHRSAVTHLLGSGRAKRGRSSTSPARVRAQVDALLAELRGTLQGIQLLRHCPPRALDMTASFGERLSALIVAAYLGRTNAAAFVDARDFLVTDDQFTHANVHFPATNRRTRRVLLAALPARAAVSSRSSPASSAPPPTARRRRSGETGPTTARPSSAPRSAPR